MTPRFALSATRDLLAGCAALARERDLPIQTHLAEQRSECEAVRERFGQDYLDVYDEAGLLTPRTIFAHAIWLSARDWRRLARSGCAVAHCPTSNVFLGSGVMDWRRAQAARVGLGSDVGAGPDLSIFRVAPMAWTLHSLNGTPPDAGELLRAATVGGRAGPGLRRPRSAAAWSAWPTSSSSTPARWCRRARRGPSPPSDLLSRILHRAGRSAVRQVYVAGVLRHPREQGVSRASALLYTARDARPPGDPVEAGLKPCSTTLRPPPAVVPQPAVAVAVQEVEHEPDRQPDRRTATR